MTTPIMTLCNEKSLEKTIFTSLYKTCISYEKSAHAYDTKG